LLENIPGDRTCFYISAFCVYSIERETNTSHSSVLGVLCTPKSSPSTAPLFFGIYTVADGERRQEDALFCLKEEEENILKGLRVRSKNTGKNGALVKQEEGESEEGGHPLRFPLRGAPRSSDMAQETNGAFSLFLSL
jgi:hypothetical protein